VALSIVPVVEGPFQSHPDETVLRMRPRRGGWSQPSSAVLVWYTRQATVRGASSRSRCRAPPERSDSTPRGHYDGRPAGPLWSSLR